ncbi:class I SAM-dependent DNA methyltransferase [Metabacillus indicus]|uniref:class I SAM-dependent DNA methyltransferase n=1 Tax=Metabacillus indicus TaxID=246786 RepID=UPI000493910C|nr:DNA methyltransferase [Metabacillus indicus]KEZ47745.1 methylase [Metabacillus indicus LMG 22858]
MLSWNEIRDRAIRFSIEWKDETSENAEAKTFWNEFFNVFGISRRRVATFEEKVKVLDGRDGFIDLLWKGVLLVEHKSRGRNLERAYKQAKDYFPGLKEAELPKYILVSDFENFALYDLEEDLKRSFTIEQLPQNIELFGFIAGYQKQEYKEQDPVNIKAAEKMAKLHDQLKEIGYSGHDLEVYLVRLLFCLFADDTGIFEKNIFRDYIEHNTKKDGSDLAYYLDAVFDTLNKPKENRLRTLSESLNQFPYVNGKLFEERLAPAAFNTEMRDLFIECCALDWGKISPAIFGSMFQSVMNPEERRELGAHYTSENNILKVIKPLFLDSLRLEFESAKGNKRKLEQLHSKLAELKFMDPACGCGNFLIIAYRELRLLEIDILKELTKGQFQRIAFLDHLLKVDVDQFYGIEIDEFPAQIAQVALWLTDHQMNMVASYEFGEYFVRLPLRKKANITHGNALEINWHTVIRNNELNYILGNPPFVGNSLMTDKQKNDLALVTKEMKVVGHLDFVAGWYIKAANYIKDTNISVGLVSTNSVVQGEQAINLWGHLINKLGVEIHFAHQTFNWKNEAKGRAAVFCVIIGFSNQKGLPKNLYSYPDINGDPTTSNVRQINQYLLDAPTIFIKARKKPLSNVPSMIWGSKPTDGGFFIFTEVEMEEFIMREPQAKKYFRPWVGAQELTNGFQRYCLYLADCPPSELRKMPLSLERVDSVKKFRLESKAPSTRQWADYPTRLRQDKAVDSDILIIPAVSSERRKIIPMGYYEPPTICTNAAFQVIEASLYLFGILNSAMHMAWMKTICGRLKSDYRYSNTLVYNNFVFPESNEKDVKTIENLSNDILTIREKYFSTGSTLADLYDPVVMPGDLLKAHQRLDKAVEKAYGKKFKTDIDRVTYLFELYVSKIAK